MSSGESTHSLVLGALFLLMTVLPWYETLFQLQESTGVAAQQPAIAFVLSKQNKQREKKKENEGGKKKKVRLRTLKQNKTKQQQKQKLQLTKVQNYLLDGIRCFFFSRLLVLDGHVNQDGTPYNHDEKS